MFRILTILVVGTYVLTGCANFNKQPISQKSATDLQGQSVAHTKRGIPDFSAMTAGTAMFGMLGALAMIAQGNVIIANNKVENPADAIAEKLVTGMAARYAVLAANDTIAVKKSDDVATIKDAAQDKASYVLDVQTINWSLTYFPTDWTHYRILYSAKAQLIDVRGNQVVAEGYCKHMPESNENAPTYNELLDNQAALLKTQLSSIADECVRTLKDEMLLL